MKKIIYAVIVLLFGTSISYCGESALDSLKSFNQLLSIDEVVVPIAQKSNSPVLNENSVKPSNTDKSIFGPKLKIQAFDGKVVAFEGINLAQQNLSLNVGWYCVKSDYFSTTGWKSCGSKYSGTQSVKIDGAGNFSFPKINVKGPLFGTFVVGVSLNQNGKLLQGLGDYCDGSYFANPDPISQIKDDLKNLNIVFIKGNQYPANIIAKEAGLPDIKFEEINTRYPGSYNQNISADLSFTYDKVVGEARTNPWHTTFGRRVQGTWENGTVSFPDQLWAIKGFNSGTSVEVDLKFKAGIYTSKDGGTYKGVKFNKEMAIDATQEINLPSFLIGSFSEVVLSLD
jgi:hypothetical protein